MVNVSVTLTNNPSLSHTYFLLFLSPRHPVVFSEVIFRKKQTAQKLCWNLTFNIYRSVHRNIFLQYNQQDAPVSLFILVKRSACFGRSFRPSSGAQNCVYSNGIYQTAATTCCYRGRDGTSPISSPIAAGSSGCFDIYRCCIRSFELLMMDGKTVRNMQRVLQE